MANIYEGDTADDVWFSALKDINRISDLQEGRDQSTKELLHAMMLLHNPRNRFITYRSIDLAFCFVEFVWIMSGKNELEFLLPWNKRMKNFADGDILHGAYGFRMKKHFDFDQLEYAYNALKDNPTRRDVVIQLWDSSVDLPNSPIPVAKDIPCNIAIHPLIRNNKLEFLVVCRSNDLIWGVSYDIPHFTMLQEVLSGWLGIDCGDHCRISDSLHVYERHFQHCLDIEESGKYFSTEDIIFPDMRLPYEHSLKVIDLCTDFIEDLGKMSSVREVYDMLDGVNDRLPEPYADIMHVIAAERLYRLETPECITVIYNCHNQLYRYIWMNYYQERQLQKMAGGKV